MDIEAIISDSGRDLVIEEDFNALGLDLSKMDDNDVEKVVKTLVYFRLNTLQNKPKAVAYNIAFNLELDSKVASARACSLEKNNTYKSIAYAMGLDIHLTMVGDRLKVLQRMADIAQDTGVMERDSINAAEVFLKYTQAPEQKEVVDDRGLEIMAEIVSKIDDKHKSDAKQLEMLSIEDIIDVDS